MPVLSQIGNLTLPANIAPSSPATYEFVVDTFSQLAESFPADALTTAGTSVSNATTNTALVTIPASNITSQAVAGSVFFMRAAGILASPSSGDPTLAFHAYSGGSGGTVLDNFVGNTLTASLSASFSMFDVESWVSFYSTTAVQCVVKATVSTSGSASTAAVYIGGNASATAVTVTAGRSLTLNAVMGSAVASSSFQAVAGYWNQVA